MSYRKKAINVTGHSRGGAEIEGDANMLAEIESHSILRNDTMRMPFHALEYAEITSSVTEMPDRDPYGCGNGGGEGADGSEVGKAQVCEGCIGGE